MRLSYVLICCSLFLLSGLQPAQATVHIKSGAKVERTVEGEKALSKKELRKKKRQQRKQFKKQLKEKLKELRRASDTDLLLLVIIAILLPPLAMALYDGITSRFWISLLLTLLFYLPGLIYTLVIILGEN
ncbi:MAG: YqaE/Pmp3 family membrane protein [Phaeodactylibacter sp.]|nr:YqaE/Pmp3 family membrane protein [Phaeodactylibacter sp.]MCB9264195.1 YqaE/Pmp3 family membrane protein [Lewinellaceae bacterium]MCB9290629.1 YqaE/Pmp3 family membrane protein [Lewinellaceae bacterium]